MHRFGGTSDVILDDLGMFWRYFGMQNHSCEDKVEPINLVSKITSEYAVRLLFVSPRMILDWSPIWIAFCALLVWSFYHLATRCVE